MRVLVCGGRNYIDIEKMKEILDALVPEVVIHGNATGADRLAELWAIKNEIEIERYPADWGQYGRSAGPIRNKQMLIEGRPDMVVAFPGGTGTQNMIKLASEEGIPIKVVC